MRVADDDDDDDDDDDGWLNEAMLLLVLLLPTVCPESALIEAVLLDRISTKAVASLLNEGVDDDDDIVVEAAAFDPILRKLDISLLHK